MLKEDRFLTVILGAIGLLVVLAISLFFVRGTPEYVSENEPANIVNNYVVALEKGDFQRAYGYLAEGEGKPDFVTFRLFFSEGRTRLSNAGLQILSTEIIEKSAFVDVEVIHVGTGLFDDGWREDGVIRLEQQSGAWKIIHMPYTFWGYEWYDGEGEALKRPLLEN